MGLIASSRASKKLAGSFVWVSLFCRTWCKNSRIDKSYQQTILTAYKRNFHYLFEFSDILPIFAKQLFIGTHLSQPCRWCSMVGLYYCISFIPIISPCIIIFGGVGHFCFIFKFIYIVLNCPVSLSKYQISVLMNLTKKYVLFYSKNYMYICSANERCRD